MGIFVFFCTIIVSIFVLPRLLYAVPPSSAYLPGETLNPSCSPGDTNCTVETSVWQDNVSLQFGTNSNDSWTFSYDGTNLNIDGGSLAKEIEITAPISSLQGVEIFNSVEDWPGDSRTLLAQLSPSGSELFGDVTQQAFVGSVSQTGLLQPDSAGYTVVNEGVRGSVVDSANADNLPGALTVNNYGVRGQILQTGSNISGGTFTKNNYGLYSFVSGTTANIVTNSYGLYIDTVTGDTAYGIWDNSGANWALDADSQKIILGEGQDASIYYDGSNLIFNPQEVGSGNSIFNNGNVGIGTSSPFTKLAVTGTVTANNFNATSTSATSTLPNILTTNIDTAFTKGSVVFADAQGILAQDNTNFKYTDSTNILFLGGDLDFGPTVGIDNTTYIRFSDLQNDIGGELTMGFNSESADQSVTWLAGQGGSSADITLDLNGVGTKTYTFPSLTGTFALTGAYQTTSFGHTTVAYLTATSTSATSTFAGNISVNGGKNLAVVASDGDYRYVYMDTSQVLNFSGGAGNTATLNAAGAWTDASDIAYKENVQDINYGLSEVLQLQPRIYNFKNIPNEQYVGFIAQELEQVIPEVVYGKTGQKTVSYGQLTSVIVRAIQELSHKVDTFAGKVIDGVTHFTKVAIESLTVKRITVGDENNLSASGITIIDTVTGEPVCVYTSNGDIRSRDGACDVSGSIETQGSSGSTESSNNNNNSTTTPESEPNVNNTNATSTTENSNGTSTTENLNPQPPTEIEDGSNNVDEGGSVEQTETSPEEEEASNEPETEPEESTESDPQPEEAQPEPQL